MNSKFKTKKVSIYCPVMHNGKQYEALGLCTLFWELKINHNENEVFDINIHVPDQNLEVHVYFLDHNGQEVEKKTSIELKEAVVKSKSVNLNSALLPESVELIGENPMVRFSADPQSPF